MLPSMTSRRWPPKVLSDTRFQSSDFAGPIIVLIQRIDIAANKDTHNVDIIATDKECIFILNSVIW